MDAEAEVVKYVSVPVRLSVWQQVRAFAVADGTSITQLCAEWVRAAASARAADKRRHLADAADDVSPAA